MLEDVKGSFGNQGSPRVGGVCRLPEAVGKVQGSSGWKKNACRLCLKSNEKVETKDHVAISIIKMRAELISRNNLKLMITLRNKIINCTSIPVCPF